MSSLLFLSLALTVADPDYTAARSIHLGYEGPAGSAFACSATVRESTPGSYFMIAGWNTGYFGIQELGNKKKVMLFSVWDPTKGDDPKQVPLEDRVELLHSDSETRIKRFGGEGTGGQCMLDYDWKIGEPVRVMVTASVQDQKTAYSGFVWDEKTSSWRKLVTFRVRTKGQPLRGYYSFVEDFRRDRKSVQEVRKAEFHDAWIRDQASGEWQAVTRARFTASNAKSEKPESVDAGIVENHFFLVNGGETKMSQPVGSKFELPAATRPLPADLANWKSE